MDASTHAVDCRTRIIIVFFPPVITVLLVIGTVELKHRVSAKPEEDDNARDLMVSASLRLSVVDQRTLS